MELSASTMHMELEKMLQFLKKLKFFYPKTSPQKMRSFKVLGLCLQLLLIYFTKRSRHLIVEST